MCDPPAMSFQGQVRDNYLSRFSKVGENDIPVLIQGINCKAVSCSRGFVLLHHNLQKGCTFISF